jgi:hypothetical protein
MSAVMIRCPETARPLFTGVEVEGTVEGLLDIAYDTDGPLCGNNHCGGNGAPGWRTHPVPNR